MPIRLLAPEVSSKIAAGEVVERPASVVKELVENSIDAGASDVSVEIRDGGSQYIRVADDGCGIPDDEVEHAFERFSTSKLASTDDLDSIGTLGFRGEAMPSIAAVSRMTLVTRTADSDGGVALEVDEGRVLSKRPGAARPGTVITVRRLFANFPARRKFLRTAATEASRIQALVARCALAYPSVRFSLATERGSVFSSPGSGGLREAVAAVYGPEAAEAMLELPTPSPEDDVETRILVSGLVSPPSLDRANRTYMSFFVNGRWVQNRSLGYAVEQSYRSFLMERRYPVAVIDVRLPPRDVDVNVHPSKAEVRFRRENQVFGAVQRAVRRTLVEHSPVPEMAHPAAAGPPADARDRAAFWPITPFAGAQPSETATAGTGALSYSPPPVPKQALPALRVLGQVQSTYIAAEGPDGMYLIDQHAAHERIVFERVVDNARSRSWESQSLLEPVPVELDPAQEQLWLRHKDLIARVGFQVEPFGPDSYLLRAVPTQIDQGSPAEKLRDVLDSMAEGGGFEEWEERAAYSIACHGAIRAGKVLSREEMMELARSLEACRQPNTCPHGRPTMIHLTASQLEREFGRA